MFESPLVKVEYVDPVYTAHLLTLENRFTIDMLLDLNAALDAVLAKREYGYSHLAQPLAESHRYFHHS